MAQVQPCKALHHTGFQIGLTGVAGVGALLKHRDEKKKVMSFFQTHCNYSTIQKRKRLHFKCFEWKFMLWLEVQWL